MKYVRHYHYHATVHEKDLYSDLHTKIIMMNTCMSCWLSTVNNHWSLHVINITLADCGGQEGVIRLFNGSSVSDGVVEYCLDSTWTPVCGDDWDESEAAVACRQLGFAGEGVYVLEHVEESKIESG